MKSGYYLGHMFHAHWSFLHSTLCLLSYILRGFRFFKCVFSWYIYISIFVFHSFDSSLRRHFGWVLGLRTPGGSGGIQQQHLLQPSVQTELVCHLPVGTAHHWGLELWIESRTRHLSCFCVKMLSAPGWEVFSVSSIFMCYRASLPLTMASCHSFTPSSVW